MNSIYRNETDAQYLTIAKSILDFGDLVPTRAKIEGKNISAYTLFDQQLQFYLEDLPILTTKKVSFYNVLHELIWILSGSTNIKYLKDNNVHIWDEWCRPDGELGFGIYGSVWRKFPFMEDGEYFDKSNVNNCIAQYVMEDKWGNSIVDGYKDQIKQLIDNINEVKKDPTASCGRRLIISGWHPYYVDKVGLPPCHGLITQFHVHNGCLYCSTYQRSADWFLGVPYNITSYSILTYIIAHLTGLIPYRLTYNFGNAHIYENHVDQVRTQIERKSYPLPTLEISPALTDIDNIKFEHFTLKDYKHAGVLKGMVAV